MYVFVSVCVYVCVFCARTRVLEYLFIDEVHMVAHVPYYFRVVGHLYASLLLEQTMDVCV